MLDAVGDLGITAVYSPDLERNPDTVKPPANHLGIEITLIPRINRQTAHKTIDHIPARHPGEGVLLAGNGAGNLRMLHQRLRGTAEGPFRYGELYIYAIPQRGRLKSRKRDSDHTPATRYICFVSYPFPCAAEYYALWRIPFKARTAV